MTTDEQQLCVYCGQPCGDNEALWMTARGTEEPQVIMRAHTNCLTTHESERWEAFHKRFDRQPPASGGERP